MPDLNENLRTFILTDGTLSGLHVGEEVPSDVSVDYIYLNQTGEVPREDLCDVGVVDQVFIAFEVVSLNLDSVRSYSSALKSLFRSAGKFPSGFDSAVEFFEITDSDDEYEFQSLPDDERINATAISLTVDMV